MLSLTAFFVSTFGLIYARQSQFYTKEYSLSHSTLECNELICETLCEEPHSCTNAVIDCKDSNICSIHCKNHACNNITVYANTNNSALVRLLCSGVNGCIHLSINIVSVGTTFMLNVSNYAAFAHNNLSVVNPQNLYLYCDHIASCIDNHIIYGSSSDNINYISFGGETNIFKNEWTLNGRYGIIGQIPPSQISDTCFSFHHPVGASVLLIALILMYYQLQQMFDNDNVSESSEF
eukprot:391082_1